MGRHTALTVFLASVGAAVQVSAQCTPQWASYFPGADAVSASFEVPSRSIVYNDGTGPALYVTGYFSRIGGVAARSIAKWNGQTWSPLGLGITGPSPLVRAVAVYDDDGPGPHVPRLCVLGSFASVGGVSGGNVGAWDGTGWSFIGVGVSNSTSGQAMAVFDDDAAGPNIPSLHIAGRVSLTAGGAITGVARWNGSTWTVVGAPAGFGTGSSISTLAAHDPDGPGPLSPRLYAGGHFTSIAGMPASFVAAWDGVSWSAVGSGTDDNVTMLRSLDEDGDGPLPAALYAGGPFAQAGGIPATRIARWDGAGWSALGAGVSSVPADMVAYDPDGAGPLPTSLYASGLSFAAVGLPLSGISRWNGASWTDVAGGFGPAFGVGAFTLCVLDVDAAGPQQPKLYTGGDFSVAGGLATNGIATWDGTTWAILGPRGTPGIVHAMAPVRDQVGHGTGLYIGGEFPVVGGMAAADTARWDGINWLPLGAGVTGPVFAIAEFDDDGPGANPAAAVAGGQFAGAGGQPASNIARWNGAWSPMGAGADGPVRAIVIFDEDGAGPAASAVFAAGSFSHAGGASASNIARWDGSGWTPVGLGTDGPVYALTLTDPDGPGPLELSLIAAGQFSVAGGASAASIARWDGVAWSPLGAGIGGAVLTLAGAPSGGVLPAGLYVGGEFATAGGGAAANLARWDGAGWNQVGGGTGGPVRTLSIHDDDRSGPNEPALFVGGSFDTVGGQPFQNLAKWTGAAWAGLDAGATGAVRASARFDDPGYGAPPVLFVGGEFGAIGGLSSHSLARWGCPPNTVCYANCDGSTTSPVLNVSDFACFLNRYAAGDPYCNCDGSTTLPVLNIFDFQCFVNTFAAGCP